MLEQGRAGISSRVAACTVLPWQNSCKACQRSRAQTEWGSLARRAERRRRRGLEEPPRRLGIVVATTTTARLACCFRLRPLPCPALCERPVLPSNVQAGIRAPCQHAVGRCCRAAACRCRGDQQGVVYAQAAMAAVKACLQSAPQDTDSSEATDRSAQRGERQGQLAQGRVCPSGNRLVTTPDCQRTHTMKQQGPVELAQGAVQQDVSALPPRSGDRRQILQAR